MCQYILSLSTIYKNPLDRMSHHMVKLDPYKHQQKYLNWKQSITDSGIPDISPQNASVLMNYLEDVEQGLNVASRNKKGGRSFIRLNTIRTRMVYLIRTFESRLHLNIVLN